MYTNIVGANFRGGGTGPALAIVRVLYIHFSKLSVFEIEPSKRGVIAKPLWYLV